MEPARRASYRYLPLSEEAGDVPRRYRRPLRHRQDRQRRFKETEPVTVRLHPHGEYACRSGDVTRRLERDQFHDNRLSLLQPPAALSVAGAAVFLSWLARAQERNDLDRSL